MASLLDEEGAISESFEKCLRQIFAKYCNPKPESPFSGQLPPNACLDPAGLDAWACDTNGQPFSEDTKEEILQFMDVTDEGNLTFKGFLQVYQLQTENDEEETWRDLAKHGFDRSLNFVQKS
ncbi:hypothetical protein GYMLUDRAFT_168907 [Collybiopsis luxurians FD-317 M1]|uniref:EF-hand domain-containing protein n=1 Tax=Collybiopsis luxurians FD-317 M1 TaxID=944289 RepID=A0A0D0CBD1_9AGAR|nr:hypothetical protein GYMLUDRAFT_168907 [Collybiopsis luxurians FD-317 M1]